ncbi:MAG: precorrin-4 C(11)-methyltransferase [Clostridiales Family XIII bacterium]|jgi:precorrin-4/cobalt-precorrin-4 C11-methyltransferase|nr:precorrin-4 C(11)-methyltransferase [Clostridiales Family XIII bacterium]
MIVFVGAGPGAADLITVRGQQAIARADVVLYAGSLVNPELLQYAKDGCRVRNTADMTLEEVFSEMKDAEAAGLLTVRLHTGDPSLYGAIREQMDLLDEAGIGYEVVPGVSAFSGAAAALKAELTLPGVSQTVILTRTAGRTDVPAAESVPSLAAHGATMVFYLSTGLAEKLQGELLAGGLAADTPVAIVYKATWPEERIARGTLGELPQLQASLGVQNTALILVGGFLGSAYERSKLYDPGFSHGFRKGTDEGTFQ